MQNGPSARNFALLSDTKGKGTRSMANPSFSAKGLEINQLSDLRTILRIEFVRLCVNSFYETSLLSYYCLKNDNNFSSKCG